jgi:hypothetical protein
MKTTTLSLIAALALVGCSSKFEEQDDNLPGGNNEADADSDDDADADADDDEDPEFADADDDGHTIADGDCDDENSDVHPGADEECDGLDNDCDDVIDEGWSKETYFEDEDGDTFGNPDNDLEACAEMDGYVVDNTDCDDTDAEIYPGALELTGDGKDNDCDGQEDERFDFDEVDLDSNIGTASSIAVDNAGQAHIVFNDATEGEVLYVQFTAGGELAGDAVVVADSDFEGAYLDAELDSFGKLHIAYTSDVSYTTTSMRSLQYVTRSSTGAWGSPTTIDGGVTGETDRGQYVDVAISGGILGEVPTFAYLNGDDGVPAITEVLAADFGLLATFPAGTSYLGELTGVGSGLYTALDVDTNGTTHVAFFDPNAEFGLNPQIQYTSFTWDVEDILETFDFGDLMPSWSPFEETVVEGTYNGVSLDTRHEDSVACITYQDLGARDLMFSCREAGVWTTETVWSEGLTGAHPKLAINDADEYFISFYDEGTKDLMLAMKRKDSDWEVITVDSEGWVGKHSSIDVGPDSRIHMSYYDESNHTLRYAVGY